MKRTFFAAFAVLLIGSSLCMATPEGASASAHEGFWAKGLVGLRGGRASWRGWIVRLST